MQCEYDGCGWHAIAPSARAAQEQYTEHVIEEHTTEVDVELPEGMVQVRSGENDEWELMSFEEAQALHRDGHADD